MVSKHKIEMVLTWYQRGYDLQLIAHHLGLDPRATSYAKPHKPRPARNRRPANPNHPSSATVHCGKGIGHEQ